MRTVANCPVEVVRAVTFEVIFMAALRLGKGWPLAAMAENATKQMVALAHLLAMAGLRRHHRDICRHPSEWLVSAQFAIAGP